jgi:hypothetical protein
MWKYLSCVFFLVMSLFISACDQQSNSSGSGVVDNDPAPISEWEEKIQLWCNEANWTDTDRQRFSELTLDILPQYYKTGKELNSPWKSNEMFEIYNKNDLKYHIDNWDCASNAPRKNTDSGVSSSTQGHLSPDSSEDSTLSQLGADDVQEVAGDMSEFLDRYDEIVTVYEKYANKEKLCAADGLKLNTEVLPKLLALSEQAQNSQDSMSADELIRYMEVMERYTNALMELSSKMGKFDC